MFHIFRCHRKVMCLNNGMSLMTLQRRLEFATLVLLTLNGVKWIMSLIWSIEYLGGSLV